MSSPRVLVVFVLAAIAGCSTVLPVQPPAPAVPAAPPAATIAGVWVLTVKSPISIADRDAVFVQTGRHVSGRLIDPNGDVPFSGTVDGDSVAFGMSVAVQGRDLRIDYAGTISGDTMSGTVRFDSFGAGSWSGRRKPQ